MEPCAENVLKHLSQKPDYLDLLYNVTLSSNLLQNVREQTERGNSHVFFTYLRQVCLLAFRYWIYFTSEEGLFTYLHYLSTYELEGIVHPHVPDDGLCSDVTELPNEVFVRDDGKLKADGVDVLDLITRNKFESFGTEKWTGIGARVKSKCLTSFKPAKLCNKAIWFGLKGATIDIDDQLRLIHTRCYFVDLSLKLGCKINV